MKQTSIQANENFDILSKKEISYSTYDPNSKQQVINLPVVIETTSGTILSGYIDDYSSAGSLPMYDVCYLETIFDMNKWIECMDASFFYLNTRGIRTIFKIKGNNH